MSEIKRAVIYARFSSDMQREESIDAQVRACTEYCRKKHYIVSNIYVDEAKSARDIVKRDAYNQMMVDAMSHKFDVIIFHKIDRNARNEFNYYTFKNTLDQLGVRYEYAVQNIDSSPEGQMMESVLVGMAAYYSRNLAKEVRKGLNENAYKALFNGGRPPFGYKIVDQQYVIEPREAEGVRMIFSMFLEGKGYAEITRALTEKGFVSREGKPFSKNSMHDILRNEKYKGTYIFNKSVTMKNGKRNTHPEDSPDLIRIENAIPAIISPEQFAMVAEICKNNKHRNGRYSAKESYLLSGKIFCGECGQAMNGHRMLGKMRKDGSRNIYTYYLCGNKKRTAEQGCSMKMINRDAIEDKVMEAIAEHIFSEESMERIGKNMSKAYEELIKSTGYRLTELTDARNATERKLNNLYNLIEEGVADAFDIQRLSQVKKELIAIKKELEAIGKNSSLPKMTKSEIVDTLQALRNDIFIQKDELAKRQLINLFVYKVSVYKENIVIELTTDTISAGVVEMRGVEPLSENIAIQLSPSADDIFYFASQMPIDGRPSCYPKVFPKKL